MFDAIYLRNTQQRFKKITGVNFSDVQRLLKNKQNSDLFTAHF